MIPTIGLEVHVQLKTRSKMFCACPTGFGAEPNASTCPVCLGYPGALPVMNEEALKMTALTGLMLGCEIPRVCKFDRKNYFYPDMPKNYQITQFDQPICIGGTVPLYDVAYPKDAQKSIAHPGKSIGLTRIHLEEDVAKSTHFETSSGIDFNRAGTPLMEIVSEPEIETPEEAFAYLTVPQGILIDCGVSDADMEKGQLRCDCNVSVRPEGQKEFGTKIEIKNMNSISAVRLALAYEIERQTAALQRGEKLVQSTRRWDDASGQTFQMREKESSHDYRYFPDPDLLPVYTTDFIDEVNERRGKLRHRYEQQENLISNLNITANDAYVITGIPPISGFASEVFPLTKDPRMAASWISNYLLSELSASNENPAAFYPPPSGNYYPVEPPVVSLPSGNYSIPPKHFAELIDAASSNTINLTQGRQMLHEMYATGVAPQALFNDPRFQQVSDTGAIEAMCAQAIEASPKAVAEYQAGKAQAINAIKGQVMKLSQGKANPTVVGEILARMLAA